VDQIVLMLLRFKILSLSTLRLMLFVVIGLSLQFFHLISSCDCVLVHRLSNLLINVRYLLIVRFVRHDL
jgi:hypothetical protein